MILGIAVRAYSFDFKVSCKRPKSFYEEFNFINEINKNAM